MSWIAAVVKGYKCVFTTTDKQSKEKVDALKAFGADVIAHPSNLVFPDAQRIMLGRAFENRVYEVELEDERAVRDRLDELRGRDLPAREQHHARDAGRGAVRGERGRGVAGRGAGDRAHRRPARPHLLHRRDEHGHPEVLEGSGVRDAALLHPDVGEAELARVAVHPEERAPALEHRDDVLERELRVDPLLLAPDARAERPLAEPEALVEERAPLGAAPAGERGAVVLDLEQPAAAGALVHDLRQLRAEVAAVRAAKPRGEAGALHGTRKCAGTGGAWQGWSARPAQASEHDREQGRLGASGPHGAARVA